jgi:hypothetical protein
MPRDHESAAVNVSIANRPARNSSGLTGFANTGHGLLRSA